MKICAKCGEAKPHTEFYKRSISRDGLQPHCKVCSKVLGAAWSAENPDKVRMHKAKARANNPGYIKKWRAANQDKEKANNTRWRHANTEKHAAKVAKWRAANPEAMRIHGQNRRARETGGKLSKGLSMRLFNLQKGKCACCKQPLGDDYHLDHIMPLALGGTNTDDNVQLLRAKCNFQKNAKHPVDFMQQRGFLL